MAFYSNVPCAEVEGSYSESFGVGSYSPSIDLICLWKDRHALVADIIGNRRVWPHIGGDAPRAVSSTMAPLGPKGDVVVGSEQLLVYEKAIVTINYELLQFTPTGGGGAEPYDAISESLVPKVEYQRLDHKKFRWGSASGPPLEREESPAKKLFRMDLSRTYFGLQVLPNAILTQLGDCNESDYTSSLLGLTFPAETLAVGGSNMSRTIKSDGSFGWNLTVNFSMRQEGWNNFWRAETSTYEKIYIAGGDEYENVPATDISGLLD